MIVEFLGLPGAGKSTLARAVGKQLQQRALEVEQLTYELTHETDKFSRIAKKLRYVGAHGWRRPSHTLRSIKAVLVTRQYSLGDLLKVLFNWLFVSALLYRERDAAKIQLLDQGILQALWSIGLRAQAPDWLEKMTEQPALLPQPQLVVVIETRAAVVRQRLALRSEHASRLEQGSWDNAEFGRAVTLFEDIVAILFARQPAILVVTNETSDDLSANVVRIADYIEKWQKTSPA